MAKGREVQQKAKSDGRGERGSIEGKKRWQ
jgi:hypothetical protein